MGFIGWERTSVLAAALITSAFLMNDWCEGRPSGRTSLVGIGVGVSLGLAPTLAGGCSVKDDMAKPAAAKAKAILPPLTGSQF